MAFIHLDTQVTACRLLRVPINFNVVARRDEWSFYYLHHSAQGPCHFLFLNKADNIRVLVEKNINKKIISIAFTWWCNNRLKWQQSLTFNKLMCFFNLKYAQTLISKMLLRSRRTTHNNAGWNREENNLIFINFCWRPPYLLANTNVKTGV